MNDSRIAWTESILVGLFVFGVVGNGVVLGLVAAFIAYIRTDTDIRSLVNGPILALLWLAVSVMGTLAWRGFVVTKDASRWRGATAGAVVGLVSHPVSWLLFGLYSLATDRGAAAATSKLGNLFLVALWATVFSVLCVGWLTAGVGALLGILVQDSRSRRAKSS